uniref:G-protein coupled receptors family 1 profile domain-containing protein n=1 Tax=Knipowitschia caucasica TaxID=637954 RepID=A0AAV2JF28_KNICA
MSTVLLWLALISHIIITIGGNVLVCLAVGLSRQLWRISNCFVVSLAITDLLLGVLVLPLSASVELRKGWWSLGGVLCNLYISLDIMLCTSSILTLMAISVDRYLAISAPLSYARRMTTVRVIGATGAIWACSLTVAFLPLRMGWNTADYNVHYMDWAVGDQDRDGRYCLYEWKNSYVIVYTTGTFYLPLLLMTGMYLCIFRVAREQVRRIRAATPSFARSASTVAISKEHKATDYQWQIISCEISLHNGPLPSLAEALCGHTLVKDLLLDPLLLYLRMAGCTARCKQGITKLLQSLQRLVFGTLTKGRGINKDITLGCLAQAGFHRDNMGAVVGTLTMQTKQRRPSRAKWILDERGASIQNLLVCLSNDSLLFCPGDSRSSLFSLQGVQALDSSRSGSC